MKWLTITAPAFLFLVFSCTSSTDPLGSNNSDRFYLERIREDFVRHKEDMTTILGINRKIVGRIDSLLNGLIKDPANTALVKGIMNTRAYDLSIVAYKDILNGNYVQDADLKLKIASHVAKFEGYAESKRSWDHQWDVTARPYLYANGLMSAGVAGEFVLKEQKGQAARSNLIADPEFRSILFDRRMFAYDVERVAPRIMPSVDVVIATIDDLLKK